MNFKRLDTLVEGLYRRYGIPAYELIVYRGFDKVFHTACGYSDTNRTVPVSENDIYWLFSETKLYTAVAVMQLYERFLIDLDDPVSKWLPEYEHMTVRSGRRIVPAKNAVTVRRLLSMSVGLGYDQDSPHIKRLAGMNATTREIAAALAEQPMTFEPGTHFRYNLCMDVLAALVEVVSGMSFRDYLKKNIFEPLEISALDFDPDKLISNGHRLSALYRYDDQTERILPAANVNRYRFGRKHQSGSAGLIGTAGDYIKLPQALANGGTAASGVRILKHETINLMRTDHMKYVMRKEFNQMKGQDYSYALGVRVRVKEGLREEPIGEFGWDGAAGALNLIDMDNRISIHYVQHVLDPYSWCDGLHDELRQTVYECMFS